MFWKRAFFFIIIPFIIHSARAQVIEGQVRDAETQEPLPGATVFIPALQLGTSTDALGAFRLEPGRPGTYRVLFSFVGFQGEARTVVLEEGETASLHVALQPTAIEAPPVTITAKAQASDILSTPQAVSVVEGRVLAEERGVTAFDVLENTPGVRLLRTGTGIAKPVLRGLTSQRVLVIQNGVRQEGQQWGDEHGPELDAFDVERIEVVKGPASLLYGSDALGGVIHATSGDLFEQEDRLAGRLGLQTLSNAPLGAASLQLGGRTGAFAYEGSASWKRAGSYETPLRVIPNTGLEERNGALRLGQRIGKGSWVAGYQHFGTELGLFEPDEPLVEAESRFAIGEPFQRVVHDRGRLEVNVPVGGNRLEFISALQQNLRKEFGHHEEEEAPAAPDQEEEHGEEPALFLRLRTFTTDARFHHRPVGRLFGTVGLSGLYQRNETLAEESLIPGAQTWNGAVYFFEEFMLDRLTLNGGLRYDVRQLRVEDNEDLGVAAQERDYHAFSGALGMAWQPRTGLSLAFNVGRAFRAPVLIELFGNGVHEGTVRFERGTPTLEPEQSLSLDATLRWLNPHLYLEVNGFMNGITNYIFPRLTEAVDPASGYAIYVYDQAEARLWGGEFVADFHPHPMDWIHLRLSGDLTLARNLDTDAPLPFTPPPRLRAEVELEQETVGPFREASLSFGPTFVADQRRVAPLETPTDGYMLWNAKLSGLLHAHNMTFMPILAVENLFNVSYINHLSRFKRFGILDPGRNLRFGLQVTFGS